MRASQTLEQSDQARAIDLLAQAARRRLLEVMGLVDHEVVELWQQSAPYLGIGEQERVVDDDKVGRLSLRAGPVDVAILFCAVDAHAVERVTCDLCPEDLFTSVQS
jgi:hypothetical protein